MNKKFPKGCKLIIDQAANGFILNVPSYAPMKSVSGGDLSGIELAPLKPYVFETMRGMQDFIKSHFKSNE